MMAYYLTLKLDLIQYILDINHKNISKHKSFASGNYSLMGIDLHHQFE